MNVFRANQGQSTYTIQPLDSVGIRNDHYKIVSNFVQDYDAGTNACAPVTTNEFYAINEAVPVPLIDTAELDLIPLGPLTPEQQANYDQLSAQLTAVLGSQPACPGDGNIDGAVDGYDLNNWLAYALGGGKSSWYDINMDGLTNIQDLALIKRYTGTCPN